MGEQLRHDPIWQEIHKILQRLSTEDKKRLLEYAAEIAEQQKAEREARA